MGRWLSRERLSAMKSNDESSRMKRKKWNESQGSQGSQILYWAEKTDDRPIILNEYIFRRTINFADQRETSSNKNWKFQLSYSEFVGGILVRFWNWLSYVSSWFGRSDRPGVLKLGKLFFSSFSVLCRRYIFSIILFRKRLLSCFRYFTERNNELIYRIWLGIGKDWNLIKIYSLKEWF